MKDVRAETWRLLEEGEGIGQLFRCSQIHGGSTGERHSGDTGVLT